MDNVSAYDFFTNESGKTEERHSTTVPASSSMTSPLIGMPMLLQDISLLLRALRSASIP